MRFILSFAAISLSILPWSAVSAAVIIHTGRLIAVKGNPLQEISMMMEIDFVMKDGKVYKRNGLPE